MSADFASQAREFCALLRQGYHASADVRMPAISAQWSELTRERIEQPGGGQVALRMDLLVKDFRKAQQRSDFLRMADLLEYQILPLLCTEPDSAG